MKNKDKPANPIELDMFNALPSEKIEELTDCTGISKREYFAAKCMPAADSFFSSGAGCSSGFIMDFLCVPKQIQVDRLLYVERKYDVVSMYPKAVAKMAVIMADELLKQLEQ